MTDPLAPADLQLMGRLCFGHTGRKTANLLTRHYNRHISALGLEITQAQLLAVIGEGSASSASEIARYLGIERSTLARNLKPLEAAGLIARATGGGKRVRPVLTDAGHARLREVHAAWRAAQDELTGAIGADRADLFRQVMADMRRAVRALEAGPSSPPRPGGPDRPGTATARTKP